MSVVLALTLVSLPLPQVRATAASTTTLAATADAYVAADEPNDNYGRDTGLYIDANPTRRALVRFDARSVTGTVTKATLRLFVQRSATRFLVHPLNSAAWEEDTVTYANAPGVGTVAASSGAVGSDEWVSIDITSLVTAGRLVSVGLTTGESRSQSVASRETATKPKLVVESVATADVDPPSVAISSPRSGTTYTEARTVHITATASDNVGVTRVEMYDNGVLAGSEDTSPFVYSWAVSAADNGTHSWTAKAYDAAGNSRVSSNVSVTVDIVPTTPPPSSSVTAAAETAPVPHSGDAADDVAIWVHPSDSSLSTVIGTDKLGGLAVYDLSGRQLHYYADSSPNNVDVRDGFLLGGSRVSIVATSSRDDDSIRVYRVNPATRGLEYIAARTLDVGIGISGLCMYHSASSGRFYVFDGDSSGTLQQWELFDNGTGRIDARKVRTLSVGSTTEGCVADDELGHLYVAEEDVAIWKYGAEPGTGTTRTKVDVTGTGGNLTADIEGLALYDAGAGSGYLIASSQGSNNYAVYGRSGANPFVTSFAVVDGVVDGVSYTDGLEVTNLALGSGFPEGMFVAQDDRNDYGNQNFKLVPWGSIARSVDPPLAVNGGGSPPPPPPPPAGTTYYVDSVGGSDANNGTSPVSPWRTLDRLTNASLAPGDRARLKRGGTWESDLDLVESGTSAAPIVLGAYGTGASPRIGGVGICLDLLGSYIHVFDIHFDRCDWGGIAISGSNNRVERTVVTNNVVGIYVRAPAVGTVITDNVLRDNNRMSVLTEATANDDSGAIGILLHGDRTEVSFNSISGSVAYSYDYGWDGAAVEIYGGRENHIHHNLAVDNDAFSELGNPRSADNTFAYNVVRSALATSTFVVTRGAGSSYGPVLRTKLINNSVLMTGTEGQGFVCHAGCGPDILEMHNNVIKATKKAGYADAPFTESHGLYSGSAQFTMGSGSVKADPVFMNESAGDLRLQATSPGIDRGMAQRYTEDMDGNPVPVDGDGDGVAVTDRGAYEYPG